MFEKEAEEYITHNDWFEFSANVDKIGNAIRTKMERAYIAGAEFGYNKGKNEAKELLEEVCNSIPSSVAEYIKEPLKKAEAFLKE